MKKVLFWSFLFSWFLGACSTKENQCFKIMLSDGWKTQSAATDGSWWYETTFDMPDLSDKQYAFLHWEGMPLPAHIWLNGNLLTEQGDYSASSRQRSFDITPYLQQKNELKIEILNARPTEPEKVFRDLYITVSGRVEIKNPHVSSKVNTANLEEAWLTLETELVNHSKHSVKGTLMGTLDSLTFTIPIKLLAGETQKVTLTSEEIKQLYVQHPRLWWCVGQGKPEMYQMELRFLIGSQPSDLKTVSFGIREKSKFVLVGSDDFCLKLNGRKVQLRSIQWTDDLQMRYLQDMGLNAIRFDGVEDVSSSLLELCDRYGLLVLEDEHAWACEDTCVNDNYVKIKHLFETSRIEFYKTVEVTEGELYDDNLIPTATYYAAKQANEPKQLIYNDKDNAIYFVNENVTGPVEGKARIALYDLNSELLQEATFGFRVEKDRSKKIFDLDSIAGNAFLVLQLLNKKNEVKARNFYYLSEKNDVEVLANLPPAELDVRASVSSENGKVTWDIEVNNISSIISLMTHFVLKDEDGEILRPVFWSDNYISLLPEDKRHVTCSYHVGEVKGKNPRLYVSGQNLEEKVISSGLYLQSDK